MLRDRLPKFVHAEPELSTRALNPKLHPCPHCGRSGTLVGHGFVRGYAHDSSCRIVRGRRLLCSNRYRRRGCGRTTAILLASTLARRVANTSTLAAVVAVSQAAIQLSKRTATRLRRRWRHAGHALRTRLCSVKPPPQTSTADPLAHLLEHLRLVFADARCPFEAYQLHFQAHLLAVTASPTH